MSDTIKIRTVADILRVPADRRHVLLRDLAWWCEVQDAIARLNRENGRLIDAVTDVMLWEDDDLDTVTLRAAVEMDL